MNEPEPIDEAPKAEVRGGDRPSDYIPDPSYMPAGLDEDDEDEPQ